MNENEVIQNKNWTPTTSVIVDDYDSLGVKQQVPGLEFSRLFAKILRSKLRRRKLTCEKESKKIATIAY